MSDLGEEDRWNAFDGGDAGQGDFFDDDESEPPEFVPLAMLTDDNWEVIRAWVGPSPTDEEIEGRFDRFQDVDRVIEETLRNKLSLLIEQPASFTTSDGTSLSTDANIAALREMLRMFIARGGSRAIETSVPGTVQIVKISRGGHHSRR